MTNKLEESLAFKTFLYCPVPGLDLVAGATVLAATAAAEACADGIKGAVKEGIKEAVDDCQRALVASGEAVVQRQLEPLTSSLEAIASVVSALAPKPLDGDTPRKP